MGPAAQEAIVLQLSTQFCPPSEGAPLLTDALERVKDELRHKSQGTTVAHPEPAVAGSVANTYNKDGGGVSFEAQTTARAFTRRWEPKICPFACG